MAGEVRMSGPVLGIALKAKEVVAARFRRAVLAAQVEEFYNKSHDKIGRFTGPGGSGTGGGSETEHEAQLREIRLSNILGDKKLVKVDDHPGKWTGAPAQADTRESWANSLDDLSDSELDTVAADYQKGDDFGIVVDAGGRVLRPGRGSTAHDMYRLHQAGLKDALVNADGKSGLLFDLVNKGTPLTIEKWAGPGAVPLRVYAVPGTSEFLLGVAVGPNGKIFTAYPLNPNGKGTLLRKDARPRVDRWLQKTTGHGVTGELLKVE